MQTLLGHKDTFYVNVGTSLPLHVDHLVKCAFMKFDLCWDLFDPSSRVLCKHATFWLVSWRNIDSELITNDQCRVLHLCFIR